jgi:hypothetical protein
LRLEARRQQARLRSAPQSTAVPQAPAPARLYAHDGEVHAVAFTPEGNVALSAGRDGKVRRWNLRAARELKALAAHEGGTFALAVTPACKILASAGADGRVRLWDLGTGAAVGTLEGHTGAVFAVAFSPDGRLLASGGEDGTARVWGVELRKEQHRIAACRERVTAVAFSADGQTLMTGGAFGAGSTFDGKPFPRFFPEPIRLWYVGTGVEARRLDHQGVALALAGRWLLAIHMQTVTAGISHKEGSVNLTTGYVSLLLAATLRARFVVEGRGGAAALSPDGRLLATARGSDLHIGVKVRQRTGPPSGVDLRLWEVLTGHEVLHFPGVQPSAVSFSPDGRHILFGDRSGAVCLVDTSPPGIAGKAPPDRRAMEALWDDLASDDAAVAYRAQAALAAARDEAPAFLAEHLGPAEADDPGLRRLIAELDAERYVVRRAAFAELARRGAEAVPALRAALAQAASPVIQRRLEELLAAPEVRVFPEPLRRQRAAAVLERIGTSQAKNVLGTLPPVAEPPGP